MRLYKIEKKSNIYDSFNYKYKNESNIESNSRNSVNGKQIQKKNSPTNTVSIFLLLTKEKIMLLPNPQNGFREYKKFNNNYPKP
jgi:hypothetical protein